jgi:hypothetical protein
MYPLKNNIPSFYRKVQRILKLHNLGHADVFKFSNTAISDAMTGNWKSCVLELREQLESALGDKLSGAHHFVNEAYVRKIDLPDGDSINVSIINQQSKEWYGSDDSIGSFDFIYEKQRGIFQGCDTFLDLGGHQLVWSTFYAKTSDIATVVSFEPSVLNAIIGLFNCLVNNVIDRVEVVPFAVSAEAASIEDAQDSDKMLVDFMTLPLKTCHLSEYAAKPFDFVKTDIEGYEFELLSDPHFLKLVKNSKNSHFELHLGHLVKRGVELEDCINLLKKANIKGTELYSKIEMYEFLATCKRDGFYSFLIG